MVARMERNCARVGVQRAEHMNHWLQNAGLVTPPARIPEARKQGTFYKKPESKIDKFRQWVDKLPLGVEFTTESAAQTLELDVKYVRGLLLQYESEGILASCNRKVLTGRYVRTAKFFCKKES